MLKFQSRKNIQGLKLSFPIFAKSGEVIGFTQTIQSITDVIDSSSYSCIFKIDLSNLAAGTYFFYLDLYSTDDNGNHLSYDHPDKPIVFKIVDYKPIGLKWQTKYHGHIRLSDIVPTSVSEFEINDIMLT